MPAPRKASSVITFRAKDTIALTPMTLGYSNLIEPETFDPDKPKLTMNGHLTSEGIAAMVRTIEEKVYTEASLAALLKDCGENNVKGADKVRPAEEWLQAALKEPKEGFPIQLPYVKLGNALHYFRTLDGERVQQTRQIQAWDSHNRKLNLKRLMLGRGSVVQPIVFPNLYFSKVVGSVQPSLKLVGVRILELIQFQRGSSNAPAEADSEEIAKVMGRAIETADLSAYLGGDEPDDDDDHDAPVTAPPKDDESPADKAKGMF